MKISEQVHPKKEFAKDYELLIGIDEQKAALLKTLDMLLDRKKLLAWEKKFHPHGLPIMSHLKTSSPLIILSGEVGCGKTALAQSVATPLAEIIKCPVKVFETPSNIRGSGLVGEISNRISEVFETVKNKLKDGEAGLLIIDEADDLATSRSQNQAHHEDRAGLNVLIKQIDSVSKSNKRLVVLMITNRIVVLDAAVRRRTSLHLVFERPAGKKLEDVLMWLLEGTHWEETQMDKLLKYCSSQKIPYSFSDLIQRAGMQALYAAVDRTIEFSIALLQETLENTEPTPLLGEQKIS